MYGYIYYNIYSVFSHKKFNSITVNLSLPYYMCRLKMLNNVPYYI